MTGRTLLKLWLALLLVFAILPGLDIAVSRLFFDAGTWQFPADDSPALEGIRTLIWNISNLFALTALVFGLHASLTRQETALPSRVWAFALALILTGPVLLVNGILKTFWGRARPAEIAEFGGGATFTPPWQISRACADNCSFVSGEAAAVTCVAILSWLFLRHSVPADRRRVVVVALVILVVVGAGLRLAKGRHFLSDVSWSVLMMLTLAAGLAWLFRLREVDRFITLRAFGRDAALLWRDVRAAVMRVLG
ncbi:phosphatase PAP2 family protein [Rhodobacterales bacterium HKCCE3408]|nr:phosphatase PAP2 family protein [Rhodobacterales bacterium HKCCE3408]